MDVVASKGTRRLCISRYRQFLVVMVGVRKSPHILFEPAQSQAQEGSSHQKEYDYRNPEDEGRKLDLDCAVQTASRSVDTNDHLSQEGEGLASTATHRHVYLVVLIPEHRQRRIRTRNEAAK